MTKSITQEDLRALQPEKPFFIGVDSDGCVFDSMELKQRECFCPAFINHFGFQAVSRPARETWEFVNLYSTTRGLNRFKAVVETLRILGDRPEVTRQIESLISTKDLETWIAAENSLSGGTLASYLKEKGDRIAADSILHPTLRWTNDVGEAVARIVHDLPPIAEAVACLEKIGEQADCVVVSQTPSSDLVREWEEHDIARFARIIAGQEQGTKSEHLALAAGGKYAAGQVLMIGDAPGDQRAAEENGFLFFPIIPGQERASWQELHAQGLDRFFTGDFAGDYQAKQLEKFAQSLPAQPPWTKDKN